jgi:hypothetical protein
VAARSSDHDDSAERLLSQALAAEAAGDLSSALAHYSSARNTLQPTPLRDEISSVVDEISATLLALHPSPPSRTVRRAAASAATVALAVAALVAFWFLRSRPPSAPLPPTSRIAQHDVPLPRDTKPPPLSANRAAPRVTPRREDNPPSGISPTSTPQPTTDSTLAAPVPRPIGGAWTFSEHVHESEHGIDCSSTGTLQLKVDEGLLDGGFEGSEKCQNAQRAEETNALSNSLVDGSESSGAVSFTTRYSNEDLTTTCKYTGQLVGETRRAMAGEVACEARSKTSRAALSLQGTWRATRK